MKQENRFFFAAMVCYSVAVALAVAVAVCALLKITGWIDWPWRWTVVPLFPAALAFIAAISLFLVHMRRAVKRGKGW